MVKIGIPRQGIARREVWQLVVPHIYNIYDHINVYTLVMQGKRRLRVGQRGRAIVSHIKLRDGQRRRGAAAVQVYKVNLYPQLKQFHVIQQQPQGYAGVNGGLMLYQNNKPVVTGQKWYVVAADAWGYVWVQAEGGKVFFC